MRKLLSGSTFANAVLAPAAALAHPGHGEHGGFVGGLLHPIGGLDHILAMVTVGILAYQIGGRALWLLPATFVAVMAGAGVIGLYGFPLQIVDLGIAASVVVLGAIVALSMKLPVAAVVALVGLFAIFHGYAHGVEVPAGTPATLYGVGFMITTGLLHALGIALGALVGFIARHKSEFGFRLAGGAVAIAGLVILTRAAI